MTKCMVVQDFCTFLCVCVKFLSSASVFSNKPTRTRTHKLPHQRNSGSQKPHSKGDPHLLLTQKSVELQLNPGAMLYSQFSLSHTKIHTLSAFLHLPLDFCLICTIFELHLVISAGFLFFKKMLTLFAMTTCQ